MKTRLVVWRRGERRNVVKMIREIFERLPLSERVSAVWRKAGLLVMFTVAVATASAQPANDMFANAAVITGISGTTNGVNTAATLEVGEPDFINADDFAGVTNSVWYQWTAPADGILSLDTFGSGFDTVLAVYTNTPDIANLVAANDDYLSLVVPQSWVTFNVVAGTNYFISVNGNSLPAPGYDNSGGLVLNWLETVPNIESGTFKFTAANYVVSDNESFPPSDASLYSSIIGARVTVTRMNGFSGRVHVPYTVTNYSSFAFSNNTSGVLVFDDHQMSADFIVTIPALLTTNIIIGTNPPITLAAPGTIDVTLDTPTLDLLESFDLIPPVLAAVTNAQVIVVSAAYPPNEGDRAALLPYFNIERATFRTPEGNSGATIRVYPSRAPLVGHTFTLNYAVDHHASLTGLGSPNNTFTLQAGSDYATPTTDFTDVTSGTLTWGEFDASPKTINLPIAQDGNPEFNEDFEIELYNPLDISTTPPTVLALGQVNTATMTILFDDQPAGAVDRNWNVEGASSSIPPNLTYPGTQGGVSDSANGNGGTVYATAVQPDGKSIVAGSFIAFDSNPYNRIVRLLNNGYQDATFLASPNSGANDFIAALALQPDGKILIGGAFTSFNGANRYHIARLNANGAVDNTFNPGLGVNGMVWALARQANGQVVIAGEFTSVNGTNCNSVARLNANGSLDTSFNPGVGPNGIVKALAVDGAGRVSIGGYFTRVAGLVRGGVARLNADGTLDASFDPGIGNYNPDTGNTDPVNALALQPDGKLLAGGSFAYVQLNPINGIARFNSDGTVDTSFSTGGSINGTHNPVTGVADSVNAITLQTDGTILLGGDFISINQTRRVGIARLLVDGSVDTTFMDTAYNQFAGVINHYHNPDAVNLLDYPQGNHRNSINAIAVEPGTNSNVIIGGNFLVVGGGSFAHSGSLARDGDSGIVDNGRMDIHPRSNVARLIGGGTPGPGNIEFSYDAYSVGKSDGSLYVSLVRTNGSLGIIGASLSAPPGPDGQPGIANIPADFTTGNSEPTWNTRWSIPGWMVSDCYFGPNYNLTLGDSTPGVGSGVIFDINNNGNITGNLNANLALAAPKPFDFFLGGELIPLGAAMGAKQSSSLTVIDPNFKAGTFGFSAAAYTVNQSSNTVTITVTRTNGNHGAVQISYATFNGTATSPANYTAVAGTLTFNQGDISKTFTVPIIPSTLSQPDKTVNLRLFGITGGGQTGLTNAVLTIVNNVFGAGHVSFAYGTYTASETAGTAPIVLNRLGAGSGTLDVTLITSDITATNGVNYVRSTNVVHWNSLDVTPKTVNVTVLHDGNFTPSLTANIRLSNGKVNNIANSLVLSLSTLTNSTLVITNVDFPGTVQFTAAAYSVKKYGGFALIPVIRTGGSAGTVTVNYATVNGTAASPANYTATNGVLTFAAGEVSKYIKVPIIDDGSGAGLQALGVILSNALPASALGSISNTVLNIIDSATVNEPPGSEDVTYSPLSGFNGNVFTLALQVNNQLLVGGEFTMANGVPRQHLARLNENGTLDATFGLPSSSMVANDSVRTLAIQTDGRILVGGHFTTFNNIARSRIARLNYDGSLDSLFDPGSGADNPVFTLGETFVNGSRKVIVGGAFARLSGVTFNSIGRLNDDGTPDATFNPAGLGANSTVYALAVQTDGKIVIGGDFTAVNGTALNHIARLNADGSVDNTFTNAVANAAAGANDSVRAIALQLDGSILIGGLFTSVNGTSRSHIARLNSADGSLDNTFNPGAGLDDAVLAISLQADGRIMLGGTFTHCAGVSRNRLTRLNPDGSVDPTINFGTGADAYVGAVVVQKGTILGYPPTVPDEKIIIGGGFSHYNGAAHDHLARIYGGSIGGSGAFEFSMPDYQADENATNVFITVIRTGGTSGTNADGSGDILVHLTTSNGTAQAGINYTAVDAYLVFPAGEVQQTLAVAVMDDFIITPNLTVNLDIVPQLPATPGYQPTAVLTIVNTDSAIQFTSATYQVPKNVVNSLAQIGVVRAGSSVGTATVIFNTTTNGTALVGTDYQPRTNILITFAPGVTQQIVTVPVVNNNLPEGNQTVTMTLSNVFGSLLSAPSNAVLTIIDTVNAPGQFLFSATNYNVSEGGGVGFTSTAITVLRTNGATGIVTVHYATTNGTAAAGIKYIATSGVLTFGDGEISKTFTVPVFNTATIESNQNFFVSLFTTSGGAGLTAPTNTMVTILNTNAGIIFAAATNTFNENAGVALINVIRYNNTHGTATVNYGTTNGTAQAGVNFFATSGTLTFNDGAALASITVPLIYNTNVTGNLTFNVGLSSPSAGTQVGNPGVTSIVLRDVDAGLSFTTSSVVVLKNAGSLVIPVIRSATNSGLVTVDYTTQDGTAQAGVDYTFTHGTLVFSNGVATNTFTVPISNNGLVNGDHAFTVKLSNPSGTGRIVSPSTETVTIIDSNPGLRFSSPTYSVFKTGGQALINVQRIDFTNTVTSVNYLVTNGTAIAGTHFISSSGTLVFTNGVTNQSFTVAIIGTTTVQPDLVVLLELSNPVNGILIPPSAATLTIHDDTGSYIIPAGAAMVSESGAGAPNDIIDSNETVTVQFALRVAGGTNVANLIATLLPGGGVTPVNPVTATYGPLAYRGHSVSRPFTFMAQGTNTQQITATFRLQNGVNDIGNAIFGFTIGSSVRSFSNTAAITIFDNAAASPYPSIINVSGVGGTLIKATVTLTNLSHTSPADIRALVVSPAALNTLFMAHAGGNNAVTNITLTFDDAAASSLSQINRLTTSTNKPTQWYMTPNPPPFP